MIGTWRLIVTLQPERRWRVLFKCSMMPDGALNSGNVEDQELIDLIEELNKTTDEEARKKLVKQAVSVIEANTLQSYIIHPNIVVGVNDRVKNWEPGSEEYYMLNNELEVE